LGNCDKGFGVLFGVSEVEDSLELDPFENGHGVVLDSEFVLPLGVCCSGSTHDYFGMFLHGWKHGVHDLFTNIVIEEFNPLGNVFPELLCDVLGFVVDAVIGPQLLDVSAFLVRTSDSVQIGIAQGM